MRSVAAASAFAPECERSTPTRFKNSVKASPLRFHFDVHSTHGTQQALAMGSNTDRINSVWFLCNGALRFHAAPRTDVANIHKALGDPRAFFCFHRLITAGTSHDRRVIHTIPHS
jgi:hypothetical protein